MRVRITIMLATLLLASCGQAGLVKKSTEKLNLFDVEEPTATPASQPGAPQIAYSYDVTYSFDRANVAQVQGEQLALCRKLGIARCVVVRSTLHRPGPDEPVASDEAMLLVDARIAGSVNQQLDALAEKGGAQIAERGASAEDFTRQVIDADAKVRAKQVLAERLLAIIRSGKGNIGELVAAERAYATTQEELDAARMERGSLARRVKMSDVTIHYVRSGAVAPSSAIVDSLRSAGATLSNSLATLITAAVAVLPWLVVAAVLLLILRRLARKRAWRLPWRKRSRYVTGEGARGTKD